MTRIALDTRIVDRARSSIYLKIVLRSGHLHFAQVNRRERLAELAQKLSEMLG